VGQEDRPLKSRKEHLLARSEQAKQERLSIAVDLAHPLLVLERSLDWDTLLPYVEEIRRSKVKSAAGKPAHLRVLVAAVMVKAYMKQTYRRDSDLMRHFAPARYLAGLTKTDWSPAKSTIWDFFDLLGVDGLDAINKFVVKMAVAKGFTDANHMAADLTAQEATIPYPNEMGHMSTFLRRIARASATVGGVFKTFGSKAASAFQEAKTMVREYRLFAKTKEAKDHLTAKMADLVEGVQQQLHGALDEALEQRQPLIKYQKVAFRSMLRLHRIVATLLPQIRSWLKTGFVAKDKIISLHIPETYSIVRGKVGKKVEFGLTWGIARLRGGYLLATLAKDKQEIVDSKFAVRAVDDHIKLFGKAPESFAYDRAGDTKGVIAALKARGVKQLGIARKGKAPWLVHGREKEQLISERAQVEGGIGTVKNGYGFNRPAARSRKMMGVCGQAAVLGFNLSRLVQDFTPPKPGSLLAAVGSRGRKKPLKNKRTSSS